MLEDLEKKIVKSVTNIISLIKKDRESLVLQRKTTNIGVTEQSASTDVNSRVINEQQLTKQSQQLPETKASKIRSSKELRDLCSDVSGYVKEIYKSRNEIFSVEDKPYLDHLIREVKAYQRIKYNCVFWFMFYTIGLNIVFAKSNVRAIGKFVLVSFFFIPNYYFYKTKILKSQTSLHRLILNDKLRFVPAEAQDKKEFMLEYLSYVSRDTYKDEKETPKY